MPYYLCIRFLNFKNCRFEDMHERNTSGAGSVGASGGAGSLATRDDHAPAYTRKLLQGDQARSTYLSGRVRQVRFHALAPGTYK